MSAHEVTTAPADGRTGAGPGGAGLTAEQLGTVHLVGTGGVGMSGLARLLLTRGIPVTGSELQDWPALAGLRELGGTIHRAHRRSNLDGVDTVVYSTAIPADHLELVEARARGLRLLHRSEALVAAMAGRRALAVAGTHGKTTTSAMLTAILRQAGLDPSYVIGGEPVDAPGGARHGTGDLFVIEADEADRSFLRYRPYAGIITNIDADHLNTYGDLAGLAAGFGEFGRSVSGFLVTSADDPRTAALAAALRSEGGTVHTYGTAAGADLRVTDLATTTGGVRYRAELDGASLGELRLPMPGAHLGHNSAAAALTALRLGVGAPAVTRALAEFPGVRRRFEHRGSAAGIRVYDEYAYHPTSVTAALAGLRALAGDGRLIVVFQPYRFYRTRDLRPELATALAAADQVVVTEVFGPGETAGPGDGGAALAAALPLPAERKAFVAAPEDVPAELMAMAAPGDLVVTMGAPPIALLADPLLAALAGTVAGAPDRRVEPG